MFTKTGRDTGEIKFQTFPKGFSIEDGGRGETLGVQFEDDFLGPTLDAQKWTVNVDGSATGAIVAALNGMVEFSTSTTADDKVEMASELNFDGARTIAFETRLRTVTSDANLFLCFGLSDAKNEAANTIAFVDGSLASGSVDSVAEDAVMFGVRAETSDNIYCLSVIANGTPQTTDSGTDLVLTTWNVFRIEIDSDGNAEYFINDTSIATHEDAVTAADPLCAYFGAMITAGSTAALVDVDYVHIYQYRTE